MVTMSGYDSESITNVSNLNYLEKWSKNLKNKIIQGDLRKLLFEEQVLFIDKAFEELQNGKHLNIEKIIEDNTDEITREGCVIYFKNWCEVLNESIGASNPLSRLYEEQVIFLNKTIEELQK